MPRRKASSSGWGCLILLVLGWWAFSRHSPSTYVPAPSPLLRQEPTPDPAPVELYRPPDTPTYAPAVAPVYEPEPTRRRGTACVGGYPCTACSTCVACEWCHKNGRRCSKGP